MLCKICDKPSRKYPAKTCSFECSKKWRRKKARLRNPKNKAELEFEVFRQSWFKCVYCGRSPMRDGVKLTMDHVTPLADNGKTVLENLVAACERCNRFKDDLKIWQEVRDQIEEWKKRPNNR